MWRKEKEEKESKNTGWNVALTEQTSTLPRVEGSEEHSRGFNARSEAELNHKEPEAWSQHGMKQPPPAPPQLSSLSDRILSRKLPFLTPHSLPQPRLNQA